MEKVLENFVDQGIIVEETARQYIDRGKKI